MNLGDIKRHYGVYGDEALLTLYLGAHADKYLAAQELMPDLRRKIRWNWAAAILGPVWLFYRKLYKLFFLWLLIGVPVDFVYFSAPRLDPQASSNFLNLLIKYYVPLSLLYLLTTAAILGCWGTYLYLHHAEKLVALFRAKAPASIAAALLAERGDPSRWRVLGGGLMIVSIYIMTYLLARWWVAGQIPI